MALSVNSFQYPILACRSFVVHFDRCLCIFAFRDGGVVAVVIAAVAIAAAVLYINNES